MVYKPETTLVLCSVFLAYKPHAESQPGYTISFSVVCDCLINSQTTCALPWISPWFVTIFSNITLVSSQTKSQDPGYRHMCHLSLASASDFNDSVASLEPSLDPFPIEDSLPHHDTRAA